jgi:DNA-binding GntR family transcriptional regulator
MPSPAPSVAVSFPRVRLVDEITRHLRELIVTGQIPAGTQLLQTELAEQLGVSRTPLREAFRILENDGIIRTSNGNRTAEVVTIGAEQLREMYEVREVIDGLAARLVARSGLTEEAEKELRQLLRRMNASIKPFDPAARIESHAAFHSLIAEASGNRSLQVFIPLIRVRARRGLCREILCFLRPVFGSTTRPGVNARMATGERRRVHGRCGTQQALSVWERQEGQVLLRGAPRPFGVGAGEGFSG